MDECYFTKSMAEWMLEYATGLQSLGNMKDACREIIRLNEVIEGMKQERSKMILIDWDNGTETISDPPDAP